MPQKKIPVRCDVEDSFRPMYRASQIPNGQAIVPFEIGIVQKRKHELPRVSFRMIRRADCQAHQSNNVDDNQVAVSDVLASKIRTAASVHVLVLGR